MAPTCSLASELNCRRTRRTTLSRLYHRVPAYLTWTANVRIFQFATSIHNRILKFLFVNITVLQLIFVFWLFFV